VSWTGNLREDAHASSVHASAAEDALVQRESACTCHPDPPIRHRLFALHGAGRDGSHGLLRSIFSSVGCSMSRSQRLHSYELLLWDRAWGQRED
jgi:hypothetical protein